MFCFHGGGVFLHLQAKGRSSRDSSKRSCCMRMSYIFRIFSAYFSVNLHISINYTENVTDHAQTVDTRRSSPIFQAPWYEATVDLSGMMGKGRTKAPCRDGSLEQQTPLCHLVTYSWLIPLLLTMSHSHANWGLKLCKSFSCKRNLLYSICLVSKLYSQ